MLHIFQLLYLFVISAASVGTDNDINTIIATQLIQFNSVMSQLKLSLKEMADETQLLRETMLRCQACGKLSKAKY